MNLKEMPELLTQVEYSRICMEMMAFQQMNNRLSYLGGNQGSKNKKSMIGTEIRANFVQEGLTTYRKEITT